MSKRDKIVVLVVGGVFALLLIVIVASSGNDKKPSSGTSGGSSKQTVTTPPPVSVDDIYNQVQNGMSQQQVLDIAKRNPDSKTENEYGGTKYENWSYNAGSQFISISFSNGVVDSKSKY